MTPAACQVALIIAPPRGERQGAPCVWDVAGGVVRLHAAHVPENRGARPTVGRETPGRAPSILREAYVEIRPTNRGHNLTHQSEGVKST